jgi:hypothetical protein
MEKRIKHYNANGFQKAVTEALTEKDNAKKLKESLIAFAGYETIEQIENYLNEKTGFVNTTLSASAMGLDAQYNHIIKYFNVIDLAHFTEDFTDLSDERKAELKEDFTIYWNETDANIIEKTLKLVKQFNEMDLSVRQSIVQNRNLEFVFTEQGYSNSVAMLNRR